MKELACGGEGRDSLRCFHCSVHLPVNKPLAGPFIKPTTGPADKSLPMPGACLSESSCQGLQLSLGNRKMTSREERAGIQTGTRRHTVGCLTPSSATFTTTGVDSLKSV